MADSAPAGLVLRGRRDECAVIDRLLHGAVDGRSGVLLVRGEAGVGKTALLEYAIGWASDLTVLRAVGVESEMELPFAALHQLCAPMLDRLGRLPRPPRDAPPAPLRLRADARPARAAPESAARRPSDNLRSERRGRAGPVPRRSCDLEPARGGGGGARAALRGRRRAVVGPRLCAGAGVRGAQVARGARGDAVRRA